MSKIASDDQETRYILSRLDTLEKELIALKLHFTRKLRSRSRSHSRSKSKSPVIISAKKHESPPSSPDEDIEGPLIKNGNFEGTEGYTYSCPTNWQSSRIEQGLGGPVIARDGWAPQPIPCRAQQFLALQPYNNRDICYVRQQLTLKKNSQYTLTFYGVSRPGAPKGTLTVTIDSREIFKEELPENYWRKYTIEFTSPKRKPILSFINYGLEANDENIQSGNKEPYWYATSIACVNLIKLKKTKLSY
jgi:hypothetical protein